jgi:hypothetical protein
VSLETVMTRSTSLQALLSCTLVLLAGCNGEPYELGPDFAGGELPDIVPNPEDRTDPGGAMEDPPPDHHFRELRTTYCTLEELAAHRRDNTLPDGTILEEGIVCPKRPGTATNAPVPVAPAPVAPAPAARERSASTSRCGSDWTEGCLDPDHPVSE